MKKIAILIYSLAGGGAERVVSILLNQFKDKYNITLVLMNNTIAYDIPENIRIVYLENSIPNESNIMKLLKLPLLGWRYKNICKDNNIEVSLSFMYRSNFINIMAKLFGLKSKIVVSERNTPSQVYRGKSLGSKVGNFLIKSLYPKADMIIPNSQGNALDLKSNYNINDGITVIENPFDIEAISKKASEEINISKDNNFVFIMVGRLEKQKRHILTIKTFSKLENINTELWIIGQGSLKEEIENLIKELSLENRVKLLGFDKNPYKYMAKADCFILSSTREGFPNVLVEALACGLPVISSDCYSGPREILASDTEVSNKLKDNIEIGKFGILVPVNSESKLKKAMEVLQNDHNLYNKLKENSKKRANDFNLTKILNKFEQVIKC